MSKSYKKICKKCGSQSTRKDGIMRGRQRYKCSTCKYVWIGKSRGKGKIDKDKLYEDRAIHKQTYQELSVNYKIGTRTVQKYLDVSGIVKQDKVNVKEIILLIDTTYFGEIGLMVFKDKSSKKTLHYRIVNYETNEEYRRGIYQLQSEGWIIKAIVCDGRRGLLGGFLDIPTQMCHFIRYR